jgi:hypothetical protein
VNVVEVEVELEVVIRVLVLVELLEEPAVVVELVDAATSPASVALSSFLRAASDAKPGLLMTAEAG